MTHPSPATGTDTSPLKGLLPPGELAPEFRLLSAPGQFVSLSEGRGRNLTLAFYPADWSPICGDELALFNELVPEFDKFNAKVVGISVDGVWCHNAFTAARHFRFPLLSDFEPKGAVSRAYGAYRSEDGTSARALFVVDGAGTIQWSYLSPVGVNPGADGILAALEKLPKEASR